MLWRSQRNSCWRDDKNQTWKEETRKVRNGTKIEVWSLSQQASWLQNDNNRTAIGVKNRDRQTDRQSEREIDREKNDFVIWSQVKQNFSLSIAYEKCTVVARSVCYHEASPCPITIINKSMGNTLLKYFLFLSSGALCAYAWSSCSKQTSQSCNARKSRNRLLLRYRVQNLVQWLL